MVEIRWTVQAADDLEAIADFIAKDSPHYARLFVTEVLRAVRRLGRFSKSGRIVPEIMTPSIREVLLGDYRIVYRLRGRTVQILTVYRGSRLIDPSKLR